MLSGERRGRESMLSGLIAPAWLVSVAGEAAPSDCRLHLLPSFLPAEDSTSCGGMTVSFTTVHRRTKT